MKPRASRKLRAPMKMAASRKLRAPIKTRASRKFRAPRKLLTPAHRMRVPLMRMPRMPASRMPLLQLTPEAAPRAERMAAGQKAGGEMWVLYRREAAQPAFHH
jgi:hypothetical protein